MNRRIESHASQLARRLVFVLPLAAVAHAQLGTPLSPPKLVNSNGAGDTTPDNHCALATDSNRFVCVFATTDPALTNGGDSDIAVTRTHDGGATWTPTTLLYSSMATDGTTDDREPYIMFESPAWAVVWASDRFAPGGDHDIWVSTALGEPSLWAVNGAVNSDAPGESFDDRQPCIAGGGPTTIVVWQRTMSVGDEDIWFARAAGGTLNWSAAAPLHAYFATDTGSDVHPRIATDGTGTWIVVWQTTGNIGGSSGTDFDIAFSRSTDDGVTWSAPATLNSTATSDGTGLDVFPTIAVDRINHVWIVTWTSTHTQGGTTGGDNEIVYAGSSTGGASWSVVAPLNTDAGTDSSDDNFPEITADQVGHFIVVWQRGATPLSEPDIFGARSDTFGLSWTAPVLVNTNGATDTGLDLVPRVAGDNKGHWVVVWNSTENLGGTTGTDSDVHGTQFLIPISATFGTKFCFGFDDSGAPRCPCGNDSTPGANLGCLNSTGVGATLLLSGTPRLSGAPCSAVGSGMPAGSSALYFQGTGVSNFGEGTAFGDGLRCVTGSIVRLGTVANSGVGNSSVVLPHAGISAGNVLFYQTWYRNAASFCTSSTFNLTSAFGVTWAP